MAVTIRGMSKQAFQGVTVSYSPYGNYAITCKQRASLGYDGEYLDPHTQSYFLGRGYRSYSPRLMRFGSPDSLSPFLRGGINAYAAFGNNPIGWTDPDGHAPQKPKNMQFYKDKATLLNSSPEATSARQVVRKKHDLSKIPVLEDSEPHEYAEYLKQFRAMTDVSDSSFQVIVRGSQVKAIRKPHKFVFTRDAELITGDERSVEFAHPMLNFFSEKNPGVISAGYITWKDKDNSVNVSDYSGHYYLSAAGRTTGEPVVSYLNALGLKAKLVRSQGVMPQ
ncbi:RHS repeat-associated core domain-containing protein [Pseudomonas phoenicis]|uniref:RHS repeat-associated core domain-containing protein n=1 Tax=unclassified Pseudomonas TaxID=196821 RepID=UPI00399FAF35